LQKIQNGIHKGVHTRRDTQKDEQVSRNICGKMSSVFTFYCTCVLERIYAYL
jgi:hypothetical protein